MLACDMHWGLDGQPLTCSVIPQVSNATRSHVPAHLATVLPPQHDQNNPRSQYSSPANARALLTPFLAYNLGLEYHAAPFYTHSSQQSQEAADNEQQTGVCICSVPCASHMPFTAMGFLRQHVIHTFRTYDHGKKCMFMATEGTSCHGCEVWVMLLQVSLVVSGHVVLSPCQNGKGPAGKSPAQQRYQLQMQSG